MITWKETIGIIITTFEITQKKLAKCLNTNESAVSKAKAPGGKLFVGPREIFDNVFDPNNEESPASSMDRTEQELLNMLKTIIEDQFKGVQEDLANYKCWETTDYKSFVLHLLKRTSRSLPAEDCGNIEGLESPAEKSDEQTVREIEQPTADEDCGNIEGLESPAEAPNEQMVRIFQQSIAEYHIATYIYNLPLYLRDGFDRVNQSVDIDKFINTIQENVLQKFFVQQNEDVFITIRDFCCTLKSYDEACWLCHGDVLYDHGIIWTPGVDYPEAAIIAAIDNECGKIKKRLARNVSDDVIIAEIDNECDKIEESLDPNVPEDIKQELLQLKDVREIVEMRKRLCELFEQICPDKHLLIFLVEIPKSDEETS